MRIKRCLIDIEAACGASRELTERLFRSKVLMDVLEDLQHQNIVTPFTLPRDIVGVLEAKGNLQSAEFLLGLIDEGIIPLCATFKETVHRVSCAPY